VILTQAQILELVKKPKNKSLIERAREILVSHRLHLKGEGLQEFLCKIEDYENETQHSLRQKLAKPATVPIYSRETELMSRIFSAQGFSKYYQFTPSRQETLNADIINYLSNDIGDGLTLKQWMRDVWLDKVNYDCTGVVMMELPTIQTTTLPEPYATFRSILDIHDLEVSGNYLEYVIFKQEVFEEGKGKYWIYRVVDDAFDYIVISRDGKFKIDETKTLTNSWGYVPAYLVSTQRDFKSKARTSYIWKSIDIANEYLLDASIHTITKKLHGFPRYWERERGCKSCKGTGSISYPGDDGITPNILSCKDCSGTGKNIKTDVSEKIVVPTLKENGQPDNVPVGGYIQIDNETPKTQIEFLDRLEKIIHKGIWANKFEEIKISEGETATGAMLDVQSVWDKLLLISENAQEVELFITDAIGEIRYGTDYLGAVVNYGKKYFIRTADEIERLYDTARKAGLPTALLDAYIEELIYIRFGNDPVELDRQLKLKQLEPFIHLTTSDVVALQSISEEDKLLKIYFNDFIERYEQEKSISLSTIEEVKQKLEEYLKEKKVNQPQIDVNNDVNN
jgi:hypothetical protein